MKKDKKAYCPGCGKHCPMHSVRCKYGRNYFAKLEEKKRKEELRHADTERERSIDSVCTAAACCCVSGECGRPGGSATIVAPEIFLIDRGCDKAGDDAAMATPDICRAAGECGKPGDRGGVSAPDCCRLVGESGKMSRKKWEKYVAGGGALWQLLYTARRVKKAVRRGEMSEERLLCALEEAEREQLKELLQKMNKQLEGN